MFISKTLPLGLLVAVSVSAAQAQTETDSASGLLAQAAVGGAFGSLAAKVAIEQFLDSGAFSAQDREIFLDSQKFANRAWRKAGDTIYQILDLFQVPALKWAPKPIDVTR